MPTRKLAFLPLALFFLTSSALPQTPKPDDFDVKEHYTKYEYRIPMRDGVRLFTAVYVPKDFSRTYPFLINRTPYSVSPYGVDQYRTQLGPSPDFDKAGYIFVMQDVRGRFMSEGEFIEMRPHIDVKNLPPTSTTAAISTTPSTGCSKMFPTTMAKPASGASPIPAFTLPPA